MLDRVSDLTLEKVLEVFDFWNGSLVGHACWAVCGDCAAEFQDPTLAVKVVLDGDNSAQKVVLANIF